MAIELIAGKKNAPRELAPDIYIGGSESVISGTPLIGGATVFSGSPVISASPVISDSPLLEDLAEAGVAPLVAPEADLGAFRGIAWSLGFEAAAVAVGYALWKIVHLL